MHRSSKGCRFNLFHLLIVLRDPTAPSDMDSRLGSSGGGKNHRGHWNNKWRIRVLPHNRNMAALSSHRIHFCTRMPGNRNESPAELDVVGPPSRSISKPIILDVDYKLVGMDHKETKTQEMFSISNVHYIYTSSKAHVVMHNHRRKRFVFANLPLW